MKKSSIYRLYFGFLILFILLSRTLLGGQEPTRVEALRIGFEKELTRAHPFTVENNAELQLAYALYQGLLRVSSRGNAIEYGDAKVVRVNPAGDRFTFELHPGLAFADGTPITAATYRDSWKRAYELGLDLPGLDLIAVKRGELQVFAIDDRNFRVQLKKPASEFIFMVAHPAFAPVHPAHLYDLRHPSIANGPFRLQYAHNGLYKLVKNRLFRESHLLKSPMIDITSGLGEEEATRKFLQKELDLYHGYLSTNELIPSDYLHWYPAFNTTFLAMTTKGPYKDARLRRAILQLVAWNEVTSDEYAPAEGLIPHYNAAYPKATGRPTNNVQEALKTLAKLGYPKGKGLPPIKIAVPVDEDAPSYAIKLMMKLKEHLNISVSLVQIPANDYERRINRYRNVTFAAYSIKGSYADAQSFLNPSADTTLPPVFQDKGYQTLLEAASATNGNDRLNALAKAESYLLDRALVVPLYYDLEIEVFNPDSLKNWYPGAFAAIPLLDLEKAPQY